MVKPCHLPLSNPGHTSLGPVRGVDAVVRPGQLVKTLINAGVSDYLDFKVVDGCYVYKKGKGCVAEALCQA